MNTIVCMKPSFDYAGERSAQDDNKYFLFSFASYFETLVFYIHYNPQKHCFVKDFRDWEWSSYLALIGSGGSRLQRSEVLEMFTGLQGFKEFHQGKLDEKKLAAVIDEEFEKDVSGF
jgi:hypothetical protein